MILPWMDSTQLTKYTPMDLNFHARLNSHNRIVDRPSHQEVETIDLSECLGGHFTRPCETSRDPHLFCEAAISFNRCGAFFGQGRDHLALFDHLNL
jgi:hypothetical protein